MYPDPQVASGIYCESCLDRAIAHRIPAARPSLSGAELELRNLRAPSVKGSARLVQVEYLASFVVRVGE